MAFKADAVAAPALRYLLALAKSLMQTGQLVLKSLCSVMLTVATAAAAPSPLRAAVMASATAGGSWKSSEIERASSVHSS